MDNKFELVLGDWDHLKGRVLVYSLFAAELPMKRRKIVNPNDRIIATYLTFDAEDMRSKFGLEFGSPLMPSIKLSLSSNEMQTPFYSRDYPVDPRSDLYMTLESCISEARSTRNRGGVAVEKEDILYAGSERDMGRCKAQIVECINMYFSRLSLNCLEGRSFLAETNSAYSPEEPLPHPAATPQPVDHFLSQVRAQPQSSTHSRTISDFEKTLVGDSLKKYMMGFYVRPLISHVSKGNFLFAEAAKSDLLAFISQSPFFENGQRKMQTAKLIEGIMIEKWGAAQATDYVEQILKIEDYKGIYPV